MTHPIGEETIRIRPDASGFRAELQAQIGAVLPGVQAQIQQVQSQLVQTSNLSAAQRGIGGVVLPAAGTRDFATATNGAAKAQAELAKATKATRAEVEKISPANRQAEAEINKLNRSIEKTETALGRTSRGLVAATAASSGFFRAVSFASGAFLVGAAAGAALGAAVTEFNEALQVGAQTAALITATGGAANVTAGQVDALSQSILNLTGIDDELVKRSANVLLTFKAIRNEVGKGNEIFDRATRAVADISSIFGTSLTSTAVQVGKALQDPISGVTALRRSGITLTTAQRTLIKELVNSGRVLTAQKIILGEIESQVGGTAEAIGQTLPGRLRILREQTANTMGDFIKRISESESATENFAATAGGLGSALATVFAIIRGGGAAFVQVADTLQQITGFGAAFQALGGLRSLVKTVTIAAVAFGSLKLALGAATAAQRIYTNATTVATAATVAEGAAAEATTARIGLGAAALRALRGPLGITVGLTALTVGLVKLKEASDNQPGSLNATRKALDGLSDAIERQKALQSGLAGRREDVSLARFNAQAALRAARQAGAAAQGSTAAQGSLTQLHLMRQETLANEKLTQANKDLAEAIRLRDVTEGQLAANQRSRQFVIAETTKKFEEQIAALGKQARFPTVFGLPVGIRLIQRELSDTTKLRNFDALMADLVAKGTPLEQQVGGALEAIRTITGKIPSEKRINFIVEATGRGMTTNQALALLGLVTGVQGGEQVRLRGLAIAPGPGQAEEDRFLAARAALKDERERLKTLRETNQKRQQELATIRETVRADRESLQAAQDARQSAVESLADARRGLADANTALLDTIRAAHQAVADAIRDSRAAVNDAVQSAKQNLTSLGQAVADAINSFREAAGNAVKFDPARFQRLRDEIIRGGGGPGTQAVADRLAFQIQNRPAGEAGDVTRQINDLTDALARGQIKLPQFLREFNKLVSGVDLKEVARAQGTAVANALRDAIQNVRRQAGALAAGPRRAGGAEQIDIVRPLEAVAAGAKAIATAREQAAKDIAGAQQNMADATREVTRAQKQLQRANEDLAEAQRRLARDQISATKANTLAQKSNTRVVNQLKDVLKARNRLEGRKEKPKGRDAQAANSLVEHGAVAP